MLTERRSALLGIASLVAACASESARLAAPAAPSAAEPAPASATTSAPSPPPAPARAPDAAADGRPCGALRCLAFASPEQAFEYVLRSKPRVLGIGEAHAQRSATGVHSATRRFGERLLPRLRGRASDIVIELMLATGRCGKQREAAVAERQKPVTEPQAESNQNEFVTLGHAAKRLSIEPHGLSPTCDEYQAILDAGSADIERMLALVAETTARAVEDLLARPGAAEGSLVLTYGGALHNDAAPSAEREAWSFGPRLAARTGGRYVELDLIVPEFIKDSESWRALAWYPHYDRTRDGAETILFQPAEGSFVLIFPKTPAPVSPGAP